MVYERIKDEAVKQGINISELEKKSGLGNGTIGGWRDKDPASSKLLAVAGVLGVSVDYLLTGKTA